MAKEQDMYDKVISIISRYEQILSNESARKSLILMFIKNFIGVFKSDGFNSDPFMVLPGSEIANQIMEYSDRLVDYSGETFSDELLDYAEQIADILSTSENKSLVRFSINISPCQELSIEELQILENALNENQEFCNAVDILIYTVSGDCTIVCNFNNLKHLILGTNSDDFAASTIISHLDTSKMNKLQAISFHGSKFVGGWPKLPVNDTLEKLDFDLSPMRYPPIFLPKLLKELCVSKNKFVTLPNISRAKLPNLEILEYCGFGSGRQNFTTATWIALRAVEIGRNKQRLLTQQHRDLLHLTSQILEEHFTILFDALTASIADQTFEIPDVTNIVLYKYLMLYNSLNLPKQVLNKIFAYCDETQHELVLEHLQSSATGLYDMLIDGKDTESLVVLEKYTIDELPNKLKYFKQELNILHGFSQYQNNCEIQFAKKIDSEDVSNKMLELAARAKAREEGVTIDNVRITF